eukprot:SAG11_NODE_3948_length_2137_cov_1.251717_3_plen_423_part_00
MWSCLQLRAARAPVLRADHLTCRHMRQESGGGHGGLERLVSRGDELGGIMPRDRRPSAERRGGQASGGGEGGLDDGATLWVGRVPEEWAKGPAKLRSLFCEWGEVLSVTVRRKESESGGGVPKSWALLTYEQPAQAQACLAASKSTAGIQTPTSAGPVRLVLRTARLESELAKRQTGALAAISQQQQRQLAAAVKIQAAMRGRLGRVGKSRRPSKRRGSVEAERHGSGERSRRRSNHKRAANEKTARAAAPPALDAGTTVWIGCLPDEFAMGPAKLSKLLGVHGAVLSLTVRRKAAGVDGAPKSWALATFDSDEAAARCLGSARRGKLCAPVGDVAHVLEAKPAKIARELQKQGTGALASIQAQQERQLIAAVKIQAAMRGRLGRSGGSRQRASRRCSSSSRSSGEGASTGGKQRRHSRRLS